MMSYRMVGSRWIKQRPATIPGQRGSLTRAIAARVLYVLLTLHVGTNLGVVA